jgi:hypothetical protein
MICLLLLGILNRPTSVAAILSSADQNLTDQLILTTTLAGQNTEYQLSSNEQLADHYQDNHLFLASSRSAENQLFLSNNSADKSQDYQLMEELEESKFLEQLRSLNILLEAYLIDKVNQLLNLFNLLYFFRQVVGLI